MDSGIDTIKNKQTYIGAKERSIDPVETHTDELVGPKHFATFPYPYMNGRLHLGHMFTFSKCMFATSKAQRDGKNVLLPFGMHCTGMPIVAMAKKLQYGNDSAIETMLKSGIDDAEITNFKDPEHWLDYFPPRAVADLKTISPPVTWDRSFITTSRNPYYDSFVRWQFNKLRKLGLVEFGKRQSICSPDGQICADHDRSEGEGVCPAQLDLKTINVGSYKMFMPYGMDTELVVQMVMDEWVVTSSGIIVQLELLQNLNAQELVDGSSSISKNISEVAEEFGFPFEVKFVKRAQFRKQKWTHLETLLGVKLLKTEPVHDPVEKEVLPIPEKMSAWVPDGPVVARTGEKCVVVETEQWYICYGQEEWKNKVREYVRDKLIVHNKIVKQQLMDAVEWIHEWGFSRETGLGTKIPWDDKYLIDSLSDSTIYMAYYTVAHYLHKDIYGAEPNLVEPSQLNDSFWNAIFFTSLPISIDIKVHMDIIDTCRESFQYWYPVDLRVSGKDLINNHLIMSLFNHLAIFGPDKTPHSFYCNGYITVNKNKMSKSAGNFITLEQAVEMTKSLSILNLCMANAGDGVNDANFNVRDIEHFTKKLYSYMKWLELKEGVEMNLIDTGISFISDVNTMNEYIFKKQMLQIFTECERELTEMRYREAVKLAFHMFHNAREEYGHRVNRSGEHRNPFMIKASMYLQLWLLYPIIPHFAEWGFQNILDTSVTEVRGIIQRIVESLGEEDTPIIEFNEYYGEMLTKMRNMLNKARKKNRVIENVTIFTAPSRNENMTKMLGLLKNTLGLSDINLDVTETHHPSKFTFGINIPPSESTVAE